jgi:hypothetical protein
MSGLSEEEDENGCAVLLEIWKRRETKLPLSERQDLDPFLPLKLLHYPPITALLSETSSTAVRSMSATSLLRLVCVTDIWTLADGECIFKPVSNPHEETSSTRRHP